MSTSTDTGKSSLINLEATSLSDETVELLKNKTGFLLTGYPGSGAGYGRLQRIMRARKIAEDFSQNLSSY